MSENQINLLESQTFTTKIDCMLPGNGVDVWRPFSFTATFTVQSEEEQEALPINISVRDLLRKVMVKVDGVPPGTIKVDGVEQEVTPLEVAIANQFTSDAAHAVYRLRTTKNGRDIQAAETMKSATSRGNSSKSRPR